MKYIDMCEWCAENYPAVPFLPRAKFIVNTPARLLRKGRRGTWRLCGFCATKPPFHRMKRREIVIEMAITTDRKLFDFSASKIK